MYTVEYDHDEITITILDNAGWAGDLIVNSFDDIVFIRQFDEAKNKWNVISISPTQWEELIASMHSPEGAFKISN